MTPLGALNFLVLQWFGVRLARIVCNHCTRETHRRCKYHRPFLTYRWVWPLTGWWSKYRFIARRP